jgi:hypothetical protein
VDPSFFLGRFWADRLKSAKTDQSSHVKAAKLIRELAVGLDLNFYHMYIWHTSVLLLQNLQL